MKNSMWLAGLFSWLMVLALAVPVAALARDEGRDFSRGDLAQMLAPVALYPDALLSQVLMASTYPLEVVSADRWLRKNSLLKGDNLDVALRDQEWDASVKALCHVPTLLGLMSERLEETTRLGDAFLVQKEEVMDTVQDLRVRALREGNLKSNDKQTVTVREDGTIIIESVDPQTVYVPYYNTRYVYGPWWYPAWPPWYWGPGEAVAGPGINFWPDFYLGFGFGFGYWSHFDWSARSIVIDAGRRPHFYRSDYDWDSHHGSWHHESRHRTGSGYRDRYNSNGFNQPSERTNRTERHSTRDEDIRGPVTAWGGSRKSGGDGRSSEDKRGVTVPGPLPGSPDVRIPIPYVGDIVPGHSGSHSGGGEDVGRRGRSGGLVKLP